MIYAWLIVLVMLATPVFAAEPVPVPKAEPKIETVKTDAQKNDGLPKVNADDFCKGRSGCKLLWSGDAGTLDKKRFVISEVVIPHPAKENEKHCRRPQDKRYGEFLDNVSQEIWLSTYGGLLSEHKKLFELCNDGYGAANIGEDAFSFGKQHITYRQSGGDNNRWVWARSYALPSLSYAGTMLCDYKTNTSGGHIRLMDYETGSFTSGYSPELSDDSQSSFVDCDKDNLSAAKPKYKAIDTKQVSSFLGLKLTDVKTLGTCSSTITSQPGPYQGYVIYGQDDGADVEVKYLRINDDKLWVELRDTEQNKEQRVFKSTDNWANDDRIEIWWLDQKQMPPKTSDLEDAPRKALRQFSVRLSDLKVFAGYGYNTNQKMPEVERREGGLPLAFQITWPPEQFPSAAGLSVSYAHADGTATKVMWSSSTFKYADPQSLSPVYNLQGEDRDPREACTITKDGALDLITPPGLNEKKP